MKIQSRTHFEIGIARSKTDTSQVFETEFSNLLEFKICLDLSADAFREITGFNYHNYRRGRLKGRVAVAPANVAAIGRCLSVYSDAVELCGSRERALDWLYADCPELQKDRPIDLADSPEGFERIKTLLEKLRKLVETVAVPENDTSHAKATAVAACTKELLPKRCRVANGLQSYLARTPALTKAELARKMRAAGFTKFDGARASRLTLGYQDATPEEAEALGRLLSIPVWQLVSNR